MASYGTELIRKLNDSFLMASLNVFHNNNPFRQLLHFLLQTLDIRPNTTVSGSEQIITAAAASASLMMRSSPNDTSALAGYRHIRLESWIA